MPLIKDNAIAEDPWVYLDDEAPAPDLGDIIVSATRWANEREALLTRKGRAGVRVDNDYVDFDALASDMPRLAVIVLKFPGFKDGRAFSQARLLRERYGFEGELRATGQVLRDQMQFAVRCGFDALEVEGIAALEDWCAAQSEMSVFYQPAADNRGPVWGARQSRRHAA